MVPSGSQHLGSSFFELALHLASQFLLPAKAPQGDNASGPVQGLSPKTLTTQLAQSVLTQQQLACPAHTVPRGRSREAGSAGDRRSVGSPSAATDPSSQSRPGCGEASPARVAPAATLPPRAAPRRKPRRRRARARPGPTPDEGEAGLRHRPPSFPSESRRKSNCRSRVRMSSSALPKSASVNSVHSLSSYSSVARRRSSWSTLLAAVPFRDAEGSCPSGSAGSSAC